MMIVEVPELFQLRRISEEGISHLSDNVVLLQYVQDGSRLARAVTVLKTCSRLDPCPVADARELLGNRDMADKDSDGLVNGNLGGDGLEGDVAHWAEVLDRWVRVVDTRLGRDDPAQSAHDDLNGTSGATH